MKPLSAIFCAMALASTAGCLSTVPFVRDSIKDCAALRHTSETQLAMETARQQGRKTLTVDVRQGNPAINCVFEL
ncbi:MAG: hypothetical protein H6867_10445 [Rhodospirillales bacterium]|nr:hypothetical protein [Rhodospirillales bacterium]MCB9995797.1 hypothetical protein [Rhodospirillales bacterium]